MPRKLVDPPSSSTGALGTWLRKLHQHLETQPNISLVSFGPTATPNSTVTGLSGDLCVNIGSGSTDGRLWIMGGAARSALTRQGWVATLPGGSSTPPAGAAGGVLSGTYPNPGFAASPTFTGTLTAAIATFSGLVTASAGATIAAGQTLTVTGTITGAPIWTNTQTLNTSGWAATLQIVRTIWGQNFDGSANVSGALTGATTGTFSGRIRGSADAVLGIGSVPISVNTLTFTNNDGSDRIAFGTNRALSGNNVTLTIGENYSSVVFGTAALSGITTLAMTGAFSGATTGTFSGAVTTGALTATTGVFTSTVSLTGLTFTTSLSSTTALATPATYSATTGTLFASTVSGATLMGYGSTGDVTLKNRAGTDVFVVTANTLNATLAGTLTVASTLTVTAGGLTVSAGTTTIQALVVATTGAFGGAVATGALTAATATFSGLVTASAGATVASGQTLTVTGATIIGAPTWTNTQTLNTTGWAATLQNVRTIWGQNFDGSANVSGALTGVTTLTMAGALTGATTGTFSGTITSALGNNSILFVNTSLTTGYGFFKIENTSGKLWLGLEGSPGAQLAGGSSPYAVILHNNAAQPLHLATNNIVRLTVDSSGNVGIGTSAPATSGLLDLTSTAATLIIPRMTTTQKNAMTAVNGMLVYDATLAKFQGYEAGAWANFSLL